ncbi:hypothetical protein P171DRAFT_441483 [Karstenula rhodostoma CBS 690.94]|uniref:Uncharacterized protein n=1 Tax=Karstenula rhodostoma CBS 690.94 TaxID=1392251 RepID=A0A9P4PQQ1_9PLEO|nr:hypothetical protein P171DRAFT_441483 [Karstenula rhodostoma CBS 690.94]
MVVDTAMSGGGPFRFTRRSPSRTGLSISRNSCSTWSIFNDSKAVKNTLDSASTSPVETPDAVEAAVGLFIPLLLAMESPDDSEAIVSLDLLLLLAMDSLDNSEAAVGLDLPLPPTAEIPERAEAAVGLERLATKPDSLTPNSNKVLCRPATGARPPCFGPLEG